jgi:hypothetical protein
VLVAHSLGGDLAAQGSGRDDHGGNGDEHREQQAV